jgi:serine/threonine-protein kinase
MGVVLHHLVTGMMPFPAETLTEVVARVLQEEPLLPSQQRPGLPDALDTVVALCLQKRPEHRFQSIEELAAALRVLTSESGPEVAAPVATRSAPGAASALADTQAALDLTPVRPTRPAAEAPAPTSGHDMARTLSESVERAAPAARSSDWAWSRLRRSPGGASIAGAALAALAAGLGWVALSGQQRSAPAASASVAQELPAPVGPPAGEEAPAPAAADAATPGAVALSPAPAPAPTPAPAPAPTLAAAPAPTPAPPPSASAPSTPAAPASAASEPPSQTASVPRLGSAPARGPATTAAGAAASSTAAPAVPRRKYEGIY